MSVPYDIPYHERRNANLPWGYWLLAVGDASSPPLIDDMGRPWRSVREAFWVSRLSMAPLMQTAVMHNELEFLLAVMVAIDRRIIPTEEAALDLLGGWDRSRFYTAWLHGQRLVTPCPGHDTHTELSPEGRAVVLMLASTRSPKDAPMAIGLPTLRPYHGLGQGMNADAREAILSAQERAAALLQYRFQRETIGSLHAIVLVGSGLGPNIPLQRRLWSMTFPDLYARDRFYLWLHDRLDRWQAWGERAYERGARSLSEHLLQVRFCDEPIDLL